ncbi:RHS repeat domain-containing protein, partial [Chitiniphilus shinanonensis]|uniref:RHS repeat domain-containing protein n=1 Tax=Chitiniphilus shinanonensis TaxID=553088 RepID=UPI00333E7AAE
CRRYDGNGNLTTLNTGSIQRSQDFDANDNLTRETLIAAGRSLTLQHQYDAQDARSAIVYPDGSTLPLAPDAFGRPTRIGDYLTAIQYTARGQLGESLLLGERRQVLGYSERGWPIRQQLLGRNAAPTAPVAPLPPSDPGSPPTSPGNPPTHPGNPPASPGLPPAALGHPPTPPSGPPNEPFKPAAPLAPSVAEPGGVSADQACRAAYPKPATDRDIWHWQQIQYNPCVANWNAKGSEYLSGNGGCLVTNPKPVCTSTRCDIDTRYQNALKAWTPTHNACKADWSYRATTWVNYRNAYAYYQTQLATYQQQYAQYQSALNRYHSERAAYEQALATYRAQQAQYQADLAAYNQREAQYTAYERQLAQYNADLAVYQPKEAQYRSDLATWQQKQAQYQSDLSTYPQRQAQYQADLRAYQQAQAAARPLLNTSRSYDAAGNLYTVVDEIDPQQNRQYDYDGLNRLTVANAPHAWGNGSLGYDGNGNLRHQQFGAWRLDYGYDAAQQLKTVGGGKTYSLSYDGWGNVTSRGDGLSYQYDTAGNLRWANRNTASQIEYRYDGAGTRVLSVGNGLNRLEFSGADGLLYQEIDLNTGASKHFYYHGRQKVADRSSAGVITLYHNDPLGSPIAATDAHGALLWRTHYRPYGEKMAGATDQNTQWFTG